MTQTDLLDPGSTPTPRRQPKGTTKQDASYAVSRLTRLQYDVYRLFTLFGPACDTELAQRAWENDVVMTNEVLLERRTELTMLGFLRNTGNLHEIAGGVEVVWEAERDPMILNTRVAAEDARGAREGGLLLRPAALAPAEAKAVAPTGWWDRELVVLDFETTAPDPLQARIVQAALHVSLEGGLLVAPDDVVCLVHQEAEIPAEAAAVHGITRERCNTEGRPLEHVLVELFRTLEVWAERGHPLVIFNANYDRRVLIAEAGRVGLAVPESVLAMPVVDPLTLHRGLEPGYYGRRRLIDLLQRYGFDGSKVQLHDASADARATATLLRLMGLRHPYVLHVPLGALQIYQHDAYRKWRNGSMAYWAGKGQPRDIQPEEWLG